MAKLLLEKLKESAFLIIPIIVIVLILHFTVAPMPLWSGVALFLASAFLMILGIMFFNLGVDMSLIPIGEYIGSTIVKSRNLLLIVIITFVVGVFVTVAEPDLIILAGQISGVPDSVIIVTVSVGVGLALVGAFLRILFQLPLSYILVGCYLAAFIFSKFTGPDFLSIAWESGAVTTGPILVPFVMALGLGLASVRGDRQRISSMETAPKNEKNIENCCRHCVYLLWPYLIFSQRQYRLYAGGISTGSHPYRKCEFLDFGSCWPGYRLFCCYSRVRHGQVGNL